MKNNIISNKAGRASLFVAAALFCGVGLMAQQSYTFTTASAVGRFGPTQLQVSTAYQSTNLAGNVTIVTQGIQEWVVPASGAYAIAAYGGQGTGTFGGRGAKMVGEFQLTAGQVLRILVGQKADLPANASYNAQYGGGGGSFVTDNTNTPLVVAGGGGGNWAAGFSSISDAPVVTTGNTGGGVGSTGGAGGANGAGGMNNSNADGGAGITGDGAGPAYGYAFINGGMGGFTSYGEGGFGGGGATSSFNNRRGGGGGGYSGGGGSHGSTSGFPEAGGGGSYNNGTNQNNVAGDNTGDGKVIITKLCNVNISASTNPICLGASITLSTNAITTTSWSAPGSPANSTISVAPSVTTSYSVTGTGTPNCVGTAVIVVTVNPLPNLSAINTPTTVCAGKTATLTGFGALTYTWSNNQTGLNATVSPTVATTYTVNGTNNYGCVNSNVITVPVYTNVLSVSANTTICEGSPASLSASGALNYTWSSGSQFHTTQVSPTSAMVYSVVGIDGFGCQLSNTVSVSVDAVPQLSASLDKMVLCLGETVQLSANGAATYVWSNGNNNASQSLTPLIDVPYTYTVTGTNNAGCSASSIVSFTVNRCIGINDQAENSSFSIFPNPTRGDLSIRFASAANKTVEVLDVTGRVIAAETTGSEMMQLNMSSYAPGVYYIKVSSGAETHTHKVIRH